MASTPLSTTRALPTLEGSIPERFFEHPKLIYPDLSSTIHPRTFSQSFSVTDLEIYRRIPTPYNAHAFASALKEFNISDEFPCLIDNLLNGFPIGDMPILQRTIIIPNDKSVRDFPDPVHKYIKTELDANRMSGPFTQKEVERILGGPFFASPLIVSEQDQGPDLPLKYRVCRNLSKGDKQSGTASVNSFVNKEDFPTDFHMAAHVADVVSTLFYILYSNAISIFNLYLHNVSCLNLCSSCHLHLHLLLHLHLHPRSPV